MGFDTNFSFDSSEDGIAEMSFSTLANYVAQCASIALTIHNSPLLLQGILNLEKPYWESFVRNVFANIGSSSTYFDAAKRGVLCQREYLDPFEVELGILFSQAHKQVKVWQSGNDRLIRSIFLYVPLSLGAGYELSFRNSISGNFNMEILRDAASEFIESSMPDDVVRVIELLFTLDVSDRDMISLANAQIAQAIEDFQKADMSLLDFFKMASMQNLIYEELSNSFEIIFGKGIKAFEEAYSESEDLVQSIGHTYLSLLSEFKDSYLMATDRSDLARRVQVQAKDAIANGGLLTEDGRESTNALIRSLVGHTPRAIEALTTAVTFIAILAGVRP
ncbi:MAG: hypothetical protein D6732_27930 [Methanobacteriota archaeon]|nr:MAG: hypothetical protein D6732_27930 [Euryarchaeota archaeon]